MRIPKFLRRTPMSPSPAPAARPLCDDGTATRLSVGIQRRSEPLGTRAPEQRHRGSSGLLTPETRDAADGARFEVYDAHTAQDPDDAASPAAPDDAGGPGDLGQKRTSTGAGEAHAALVTASTPLPAPGTLLGGSYRIGSEIAHGAMGVVLSAFDVNLQRPVAIKLVRADLLSTGHRRRLLDEARAMARVSHPNVVRIYAFGNHLGLPYIVMEQIEGENLQHWLREHAPAQPAVALRLLHEVCAGVSAIHAAGTVHRDLKPSNILLDGALTAKVADFGACAAASGRQRRDVLGTPGYMPPEALAQPTQDDVPSPRSDVYSLGCIAYELLTGRHPFRLDGAPPTPVMPPRAAAIAPPSSICPHLPRALDQLVLGALEWDIEQRPPSVEAFRQGLLAGAPGPAPQALAVS